MSHEDDVRLLVLDLCQQCLDSVGCEECQHFDDSLETGGCDLMHRIVVVIDALMEEHEAATMLNIAEEAWDGGHITMEECDLYAHDWYDAHDNAERLMNGEATGS